MNTSITVNENTYTRINNDYNGNGRYVVHFFRFIKDSERYGSYDINELYELALIRAKKIGGRKFHNKQYGGGIVFQSNSPNELDTIIKNHMDKIV